MKKFINILALLIVLSICVVGCASDSNSAGGSSDNKDSNQAAQTEEKKDNGTSSDKNSSNSSDSAQTNKTTGLQNNIPEETQNFMNNITGTWESSTPLADGNASIIRVKIDNVSGFTFTTGTQTPDGTGSFYSRVGSYEIDGDKITFSATTGGESNDGSSYNLKQDFGVFTYTITENPELTQIVLTPTNDRAVYLTGQAPVTLNKV